SEGDVGLSSISSSKSFRVSPATGRSFRSRTTTSIRTRLTCTFSAPATRAGFSAGAALPETASNARTTMRMARVFGVDMMATSWPAGIPMVARGPGCGLERLTALLSLLRPAGSAGRRFLFLEDGVLDDRLARCGGDPSGVLHQAVDRFDVHHRPVA